MKKTVKTKSKVKAVRAVRAVRRDLQVGELVQVYGGRMIEDPGTKG